MRVFQFPFPKSRKPAPHHIVDEGRSQGSIIYPRCGAYPCFEGVATVKHVADFDCREPRERDPDRPRQCARCTRIYCNELGF